MQYGYNEDHWIWEAEWEDISSRMNAEVMSARKTVLVRNAGWAPNAQGLIGFVTMHQSAFSSAPVSRKSPAMSTVVGLNTLAGLVESLL